MYRKIYALIQTLYSAIDVVQKKQIWQNLNITKSECDKLQQWWTQYGNLPQEIAKSSDRVNLQTKSNPTHTEILVKHPISGQQQEIKFPETLLQVTDLKNLDRLDSKQLFWWLWRFIPELKAQQKPENLLTPAHLVLPDCPVHSYASTVSALIGAMYPETWQDGEKHKHPYLLLFTFSPVQEFIKASRKFVDFWAGSYLLHYLSVKLCWCIAQEYGPDAIITPSLWGQEIIDALMIQEFDLDSNNLFRDSFNKYVGYNPIDHFNQKKSSSLSTAGFPNIITALVPGRETACELGKKLKLQITNEWGKIALKVREEIRRKVMKHLEVNETQLWETIATEFPDGQENAYRKELTNLKQGGCWEWNKIWEAQISHSWETYWTAIPLGNPDLSLSIATNDIDKENWKEGQLNLTPPRSHGKIPTEFEEQVYEQLNVGTWWGALQARLGQSIQAVKNTRNWHIPTAPGERSTLSGQFSAVHPRFKYQNQFKEGGGIRESSMRLFWRVMAEVYPGLFNGSEKLNAIELTKRMAWKAGGVAASLGIENHEDDQDDYETIIRFPNLSSIAAARFIGENPQKTKQYWQILNGLIKKELPEKRDLFASRTRSRPLHIPKSDRQINPNSNQGQNLNGVMFSSKWLADDLNCNQEEAQTIRKLVEQAHKKAGFGDASPADWWVIVLADGDNMGKYVSGRKLKPYQEYLNLEVIEDEIKLKPGFSDLREKTTKRMGPATHVALNRALLDFSNRLVPYLTEERFCGKVVYSGGDDVMAVLPLPDLPEYLLSLRAAWCGGNDPYNDFLGYNKDLEGEKGQKTPEFPNLPLNTPEKINSNDSGYWHLQEAKGSLPKRPYFTMGKDATMSLGIVIAHKTVPLPTVLENLWTAEKDKAKKIAGKDGLCFRVIYSSGNILEALMKGDLLSLWWDFLNKSNLGESNTVENPIDLRPLLYRLAEELPRHACVTKSDRLISKAAQVIINKRDESLPESIKRSLIKWLDKWEDWVNENENSSSSLGTTEKDLGNLLRFSAFWLDKMQQYQEWMKEDS